MSRGKTYSKKIKKDYQRHNLSNPFFNKPKKGKRKHVVIIISLLSVAFLILLIWFFCCSSVWQINNIKVEGLTRISDENIKLKIQEQMEQKRYGIFKQNNILIFNKEEVQESILSSYNLASLEIIKKLPKTLIVKVGERPYAFIFQQGNDFFYASADAYTIREEAVSDEDKQRYFILENKNDVDFIGLNNKINISDEYLKFIFDLNNNLSDIPELPIERFIIDQEFNTVQVKFSAGPLAYFNIKKDAGEQIADLVLVKKEKIKDNFNKTNYIDLRYGDRIYIY
ncbi:hypothetical protein GX917_02445 [Candidatus Falkowbacteria bacterium]|jgi:cell division septal protein FtsQ|nr:hypothetical protein [Candidatus Falkowbacteria bacterium]